MRDITVAITEASYSGNKGAAAMLQSSIQQLHDRYGEALNVNLMSVYPADDRKQVPFDFVKVVPAKPKQVLFMAFPGAVLYKVFRWLPPVRKLLLKQPMLKAYARTDLVLNEAGVSLVDSRGFIMNVYSFVCSAIPMLMGVPVIKYCQALGTFKKAYNRFLAKWQLPKIRKIFARGEITRQNLEGIGITENVTVCADGAFSMEDDPAMTRKVGDLWAGDPFFRGDVVGLSISVVVHHKCQALGIEYPKVIAEFIGELNRQGYKVLLIANAARINSTKTRTNDLLLGDEIYAACGNREMVRWYHEEMTAEELREHIGRCRFLVASRFHSMIAGLERGVPVMLVGWSHKYKEVLDMFELGEYTADYSSLSRETLMTGFEKLRADEEPIRRKLTEHIDAVRESSRDNIRLISEELDRIMEEKESTNKGYSRLGNPGDYQAVRKGYALKDECRQNAASGGLVTALLCNLLRHGDIDGAWVTKAVFDGGKATYKTFIATTEAEIRDAGSSVYLNVPLLSHLDLLRGFNGRIAAVMQPCMMKAFSAMLEKEPALKEKVALKLGLFCSGSCSPEATDLALRKAGIRTEGATRLFYRRGFWRGPGTVEFADGHQETFSYTKTFCTYKNAYFFSKAACFSCRDHFAENADVSFGDVWLKEMKKEAVKHTGCVIRSEKALAWLKRAEEEGDLTLRYMGERDLLRSQKRALAFKFRVCPKEGRKRWNDRLAFRLAEHNRKASEKHPGRVARWPQPVLFLYMCFIRWLMNF